MALDLGELVAFLDLDTSKWDAAVDRTPSKFTGKAAAFGAAGLVVGGVLAAAMAKGLTDAINFDATNDKVAAQLGLTEAESARVGTLAGKVYAQNYGESVEQVQQAIGGVVTQIEGMADANDAAVEGMTAKVLNYSSAFEVETSEAIAMVQQLMSNGLAGTADEAMDLMTTAMQKVPEALRGDMTDAITEYGPFLASLGMSGEEAFDLLARGAERGMYGIDKAGDALKEFTIRGSDMSKASSAAYEAIGLDAEDMSNAIASGGDKARDALDKTVEGILAIEDPAERANTAIALFGTPLEDLGVNEIPKFLESLQGLGGGFSDAAGSADAMGATMSDNVAAQMEAVNRQIEVLFAGLMSTLLPALQGVFGFMASNPAVVQAVALALGVLAVAFIGVSVATWAMNTALLANPITWIIIGIMALIAALILLFANWDTVAKWISDVWSGFISWAKDVLDAFAAWWGDLWDGVGQWITDVWNGFIGFITDVFDGFVSWLRSVGDGVASWWSGLWNGIGSFFRDIWNGIVRWAVSTITGFISNWQTVWGKLTSFFSTLWNGIGDAISNAWEGILSFFRGIPDTIKGFFTGVGSWLYGIGRDLINGLLNGISSLASTIGSFFLNLLPDWIREPFKAALGIHSPSTEWRGYGRNTVQGYLLGVDDMQPDLDKRMGALVTSGSLALDVKAQARTAGQYTAKTPAPGAAAQTTFNYYAAENRSLTSEEELFAALGSPRSPFGGNL